MASVEVLCTSAFLGDDGEVWMFFNSPMEGSESEDVSRNFLHADDVQWGCERKRYVLYLNLREDRYLWNGNLRPLCFFPSPPLVYGHCHSFWWPKRLPQLAVGPWRSSCLCCDHPESQSLGMMIFIFFRNTRVLWPNLERHIRIG